MDIADTVGEEGELWKENVVNDIAQNVGLPPTRIEIVSVEAASVAIVFRFIEYFDDDQVKDPDASAAELSSQLEQQTGVFAAPSFENYQSHEITKYAHAGHLMHVVVGLVVFLVAACVLGGVWRVCQSRAEQRGVKAELAQRSEDGHDSKEAVEVVATPPAADRYERVMVAAKGGGGGWGTVRSAAHQMQSARAMNMVRAPPPLPVPRSDGFEVEAPAPVKRPGTPPRTPAPQPEPEPAPSPRALPPRALPPRAAPRPAGGGATPPPPVARPAPARALPNRP